MRPCIALVLTNPGGSRNLTGCRIGIFFLDGVEPERTSGIVDEWLWQSSTGLETHNRSIIGWSTYQFIETKFTPPSGPPLCFFSYPSHKTELRGIYDRITDRGETIGKMASEYFPEHVVNTDPVTVIEDRGVWFFVGYLHEA